MAAKGDSLGEEDRVKRCGWQWRRQGVLIFF